MTQVFQAVYENGVLRPLETIHLSEHEQVRVTIEGTSNKGAENTALFWLMTLFTGFVFPWAFLICRRISTIIVLADARREPCLS